MGKIAVVYWSGTGNTEEMANAVLEGARQKGADAALYTPDSFDASMIEEQDAIAFGCPSMGCEELEDTEFEPMFSSCREKLGGKKVALFGSYGWGDGEWMRSWADRMSSAGAVIVDGEGLIANLAPDEEAVAACKALGAKLVQ